MPERKFRWAIGVPGGRQAPPWTLTVRRSEFTLGVRVRGGRGHISFHESGERHWRFDSPAALARAGGLTSGRDADVWQAPDPVNGVVTEFTVIVPTTELRAPRSVRLTGGITWFDPAPFGDAVRIVIARQPAGGRSVIGMWAAPLGSGTRSSSLESWDRLTSMRPRCLSTLGGGSRSTKRTLARSSIRSVSSGATLGTGAAFGSRLRLLTPLQSLDVSPATGALGNRRSHR